MIDDARMELIQQIKAEVERRIKRNKEEYAPDGLFEVQDNLAKLLSVLSDLEKSNSKDFPTTDEEMAKFLATHPKVELPEKYKTPDWIFEKSEEPMNPTIEKLRALIKMQIRREELNFASLGGGGQTMNIGALEWVLKQLDTLQEQPVKDYNKLYKDIAKSEWFKKSYVGKSLGDEVPDEQPLADGLEEEIQRFLSNATKMDKGEWKGKYPISEMGFGVVARHFAQWGAEHLKK